MTQLDPVTGKIPSRVREELEEEAEARGVSRSTVIREHLEAAVDDADEEEADPTPDRSASPLSLVGVVSLAIAPTLLATGYTAAGSVAGVVAAAYALLWVTATDVVVEEALGEARDELREAGGVFGFFRHAVADHPVEDPDTVVERAARLDMVGLGLLVGLLAVLLPLGVAGWVGVLGEAVATIGSAGVTAYVVLVVALGYAAAFVLGVSAVASLAIASARSSGEVVDDVQSVKR